MSDDLTWSVAISLAKNSLRASERPMTYEHFLRVFHSDFSLDFQAEALKAGFADGVEALESDAEITVNRTGASVVVCCLSRRTLERQKKPVVVDLCR